LLSFAHVHANGYAQRVLDHPEARIQRIWDDDPERGKIASERWDAPLDTDLEKVGSRPDVDAVVLNAETAKHAMVMRAAIHSRPYTTLSWDVPSSSQEGRRKVSSR
jgi:predicted dehydrogenase